jgi:Heparinase II/III N-terminus/Heparinase II/III-like protein
MIPDHRLAAAAVATAVAMMLGGPHLTQDARGASRMSFKSEVELLLGRLDLSLPGLKQVRAARTDPTRAATELLAYYRNRKSVKHPEERFRKQGLRGRKMSPGVKKIADDALRNILVASPNYPRHNFGSKIDWYTNRNPNRDNEWIWQLHRHSSWGALGTAYSTTAQEKYAGAYVRQLLDWIEKCPLSKMNMKRRGHPAWRTIEAGIRGRSWTVHFQQFVDSPNYTPEALVRFLNSCHAHAAYLSDGREYSRNNWGLMEAEGTAFIAMTFPEFRKSKAWRRKSIRHIAAQIEKQVRSDGMQFEQCLGYHMGCIGWFSRTAKLAGMNGLAREFPAKFWKRLEAMCEVPMKLCTPDGLSAQFGDDSHPMNCRRALANWAGFFKREDFAYVASAGKRGKAPKQTAFALRESGFYSMRSSWSERATCMVLKCGLDGGWHCQPDNGSFEVFAGGRRLTPDSGTYIYHGNAQAVRDRAWFRQTRVHATMTLGGKDTAYKPKLKLWKPGKQHDVLVVENAGYRGFTHRRAIIFVNKKFFVIIDEALGKATGKAFLHFQLPPGKATLNVRAMTARTGFSAGTNLLIAAMPQSGLKMIKEKGQVSFKYGSKQPRPAFRYELKKGRQSLRFVTMLLPHEGPAPRVEIKLVGNPRPGAKKIELDVTVDDKKTRIGYQLD